ncbi:bifunctional DNA-formamidopyrimidine glycosylase/DNA-(apurinic or apyrimidinic site) lyase [bacterium]|nr:bifunctional DNA-formamidopyrimidine glycosylase/DNA-(apurinic or apyrimidinic site) lyase [bacterium]
MPELPEVETMCRGIRSIIGCRFESVNELPCRLRPILIQPSLTAIASQLVGTRVDSVSRLGKRVLIRSDNSIYIVIEPRMTGLVLLKDPPNQTHLRLEFCLSRDPDVAGGQPDHMRLLFWDRRGLGTVRCMTSEELDQRVCHRLGPDALAMDDLVYRQRLGKSTRAIKVALMDQAAVAGIGNLYASEILFLAGIDPRTRCHRLSRDQWSRIHQAARRVLLDAIEYEGSTLSDGTYRNAINGEGGYQHFHRVYDREDEPCGRCRQGRIRRTVQAQRSTFFCPACQLRRGRHSSWVED